MFLSKRSNGIWYIFYDNTKGKRTCISTKTQFKRDALKFLSNFQTVLNEREKSRVIPILMKDYSFQFLKYSESVHSSKTTKTFKTTFKFFNEIFGAKYLTEIDTKMLTDYFQERINSSSIYASRKDLINLSSAFTKAVQDNYLISNPCNGIKRLRIPEKQPLFFNEADIQTLLNVVDNKDLRDLIEFALNTGLRQMELLTLEWNQINFKDNLLILDNRNHLTKSKKIRTIPLNIKALQILTEREMNKKSELIFTFNNLPITQNFISKAFKKYVISAKLNSKLKFHSLRHTFASWLVQRGVSIYEVSKLLGHSDIKVTEIYSHLRAEDLRESVEKLNN